jgi:hypothetical protein
VNPDVAAAIASLRTRRVLSEPQAAPLLRWARGEVVSLHWELRAALYAGVLLATTGVGLFLKDNQERVGPAAIASLLGLCAGTCLLYVLRRSPPFSWQATPTPLIAVDYVLLLGVLILGSDIAYVETQFRWLGPNWPLHLLFVSLLYLAVAYRFDSRAVLSLALSSFAAWRGVAAALPFLGRSGNFGPTVRANALACGMLFVGVGILTARTRLKAHFEGVWVTLGLLLFFGGLLSGVFQGDASDWPLWEIPLALCAGVVIAVAYRLRRPVDFAVGALAAYLGALRWLGEALDVSTAFFFTVGFSSLALIVLLVRAQRRMKEAG